MPKVVVSLFRSYSVSRYLNRWWPLLLLLLSALDKVTCRLYHPCRTLKCRRTLGTLLGARNPPLPCRSRTHPSCYQRHTSIATHTGRTSIRRVASISFRTPCSRCPDRTVSHGTFRRRLWFSLFAARICPDTIGSLFV